jgi:hypothetical protein
MSWASTPALFGWASQFCGVSPGMHYILVRTLHGVLPEGLCQGLWIDEMMLWPFMTYTTPQVTGIIMCDFNRVVTY